MCRGRGGTEHRCSCGEHPAPSVYRQGELMFLHQPCNSLTIQRTLAQLSTKPRRGGKLLAELYRKHSFRAPLHEHNCFYFHVFKILPIVCVFQKTGSHMSFGQFGTREHSLSTEQVSYTSICQNHFFFIKIY